MSGTSAESCAVDIAAGWARRFLLPKGDFKSAVSTAAPAYSVHSAIASFRGRSREIVVHTAPTTSRSRRLGTRLSPEHFDPWIQESQVLAAQTRQLATCGTCSGAKTVSCPQCRGTSFVTCQECNGAGVRYSSRSGRSVQCPGCRGRGQRRCPCRDGSVKCLTCEGRGKVEEWLEIVERPLSRLAHAAADSRAHSLNEAASQGRVRPFERWQGESVADAPEAIRSVLIQLERSLALRPKEDRVEVIELDMYQGWVTEVTYELCQAEAALEIQEWDRQVVEASAGRIPLLRWRQRALAATSFMFLGGLAVAGWYSFRHPFFASKVWGVLLWLLAPFLGLTTFRPLLLCSLPRRSVRRIALSMVPLAAVLSLTVALAAGGSPSLKHATRLAEAGRLKDALTEASACVAVGREPEGAAAFHDRLRLQRVIISPTASAAWAETKEAFFSHHVRQEAEQAALNLTAQEMASRIEEGHYKVAKECLDLVPQGLRDRPQVRPLRFEIEARQARACIKNLAANCTENALRSLLLSGFTETELLPLRESAGEVGASAVREAWRTISSPAASLDARLAACQKILAPLQFVERVGTDTELPVARAKVDQACNSLREREERARQARWRAWAYAPLLCNDGSHSPKCVCGQSSRRGCCSWHGGVAGCSAPYPDE